MVGYHGPIVMTHPTKAIIPLMLDDYIKVWNKNYKDREPVPKPDGDNKQLSTGEEVCYTKD
jgi:predicted metal-dependent RNase